MDEVSNAPKDLGNNDEADDDAVIPKVNMRFDGHSWTNKNNISRSLSNSQPSVSNIEDHQEDKSKQLNVEQQNSSSSSSNDDHEIVFQVEGDYDDEETLEEDGEGDEEELDDLAKQGEMPLDDLLALYYSKPGDENADSSGENEKTSDNENEDGEESKNEGTANRGRSIKEDTRQLRCTSFLSPSHSQSGDEENDRDYVPHAPDDWKKAPRVGKEFQVEYIPDNKQQIPDYDDSADQLVWNPSKIDSEKVKRYLTSVSGTASTRSNKLALPFGSHMRDNEDALYLLTQSNNDVEEAIRRYKQKPHQQTSDMPVLTLEECRQFEQGLTIYGKNFHDIHHNKVKTKTIGEIVKFYYIWKKSERYDNFSAKTRLGKKKDMLHPGVTDYMERLLDETENSAPQQRSHINSSTSSYPPSLTHTAALQQHLIDLRVTRNQNNQQSKPGSTDGYSDVNGCSKAECIDDVEMFETIVPPLPVGRVCAQDLSLSHVLSDSDRSDVTSLSTNHHTAVTTTSALENNNSGLITSSSSSLTSCSGTLSRAPSIPASAASGRTSKSSSEIPSTTSLHPDALSTTAELETVTHSSSGSVVAPSCGRTPSILLDSTSMDSRLGTRETFNFKRFQSSDYLCNTEAKRQRTSDSSPPSSTSEAVCSISTNVVTSTARENDSYPSTNRQATPQSDLPHESISDAQRIASC